MFISDNGGGREEGNVDHIENLSLALGTQKKCKKVKVY